MTKATLIQRMSFQLRHEARKAIEKMDYADFGLTASDDLKTIAESDGSFYGMYYYRNGIEVIAIPDFYIDEDCISLVGSQGNNYTLYCGTLYAGFHVAEPMN